MAFEGRKDRKMDKRHYITFGGAFSRRKSVAKGDTMLSTFLWIGLHIFVKTHRPQKCGVRDINF